jgi:hypothetical protein
VYCSFSLSGKMTLENIPAWKHRPTALHRFHCPELPVGHIRMILMTLSFLALTLMWSMMMIWIQVEGNVWNMIYYSWCF